MLWKLHFIDVDASVMVQRWRWKLCFVLESNIDILLMCVADITDMLYVVAVWLVKYLWAEWVPILCIFYWADCDLMEEMMAFII